MSDSTRRKPSRFGHKEANWTRGTQSGVLGGRDPGGIDTKDLGLEVGLKNVRTGLVRMHEVNKMDWD